MENAEKKDPAKIELPIRIPLRHPEMVGGIKELVAPRMITAGDLERLDGLGDIGRSIKLISITCDIPIATARALHPSDVRRAGAALSPLLEDDEDGPETGENA